MIAQPSILLAILAVIRRTVATFTCRKQALEGTFLPLLHLRWPSACYRRQPLLAQAFARVCPAPGAFWGAARPDQAFNGSRKTTARSRAPDSGIRAPTRRRVGLDRAFITSQMANRVLGENRRWKAWLLSASCRRSLARSDRKRPSRTDDERGFIDQQ